MSNLRELEAAVGVRLAVLSSYDAAERLRLQILDVGQPWGAYSIEGVPSVRYLPGPGASARG